MMFNDYDDCSEEYKAKNKAVAGGGSAFPACQLVDDPKSDDNGGVFFFEDAAVSDFEGLLVKGARAGKVKPQEGNVLSGVFIDAMMVFVLDGGRRRVQVWRSEKGNDGQVKPRSTTMLYVGILPAKGATRDPKIVRIVGRGLARAEGFTAAMKPIRDAGDDSHIRLTTIAADLEIMSKGEKPRKIRTISATIMKTSAPARLAQWADTVGMPAASDDANMLIEAAKAREAEREQGEAIARGGQRGGAAQGGQRGPSAAAAGGPGFDDEVPF